MTLIAPTNVTASDGLYTNGVQLTWSYAGSDTIDRWDIYRWTSGQAPVFYTSVFGGKDYLDKFDVYGIPSDKTATYFYALKAYSYFLGLGPLSGNDTGYIAGAKPSIGIDTPPPTSSKNSIVGTASSETLQGTSAADYITGLDGDDIIEGGLGDDLIDGGQGYNTASYLKATSPVNVNLGTGKATGGGGNDTLINIQQIYGSVYNDTLIGDANSNNIRGGAWR